MTSTVASVTYNQAPISPFFDHTLSSAKKASQLAQSRFSQPAPASTPTLSENKAYDVPEKLYEAYQHLEAEENKEALQLFQEIGNQRETANLPKDSLVKVHCDLGLAYADQCTRDLSVASAKENLRIAETNNQGWSSLDEGSKSKAFLELWSCYKLLLPLIPPHEKSSIQEITNKIDACNKYILPLDKFNAMVREADRCVERKEPGKAREIYYAALDLSLPRGQSCALARVSCHLKYISTYSKTASSRGTHLDTAMRLLNQLFSNRTEVCKEPAYLWEPGHTKDLVDLFKKLLALLPEGHNSRTEIQNKIDICMSEVPRSGEDKSIPDSSKRVPARVLVIPKGMRIFIKVVFLALAALGAFTLGKRSISIIR